MKAYEVPGRKMPDGRVEIPEEVAELLPSEKEFRVIILLNETDAEGDRQLWSRFTQEQFLKGYGDADAKYDEI